MANRWRIIKRIKEDRQQKRGEIVGTDNLYYVKQGGKNAFKTDFKSDVEGDYFYVEKRNPSKWLGW